jgi:cell division protein FtsB
MSKQVKWLLIILIIVFLVLQYRLWFGRGGIVDMLTLKKQTTVASAQVDVLTGKNSDLIDQVNDLKEGDVVLAKHARNDLGLVDQGEVYFQLVNKDQEVGEAHENIIE